MLFLMHHREAYVMVFFYGCIFMMTDLLCACFFFFSSIFVHRCKKIIMVRPLCFF